jgi:hypothetical protein
MKFDHQNPQTQTPNRPLRSDFTAYTLRHAVVAQKRATRWQRFRTQSSASAEKDTIRMKLIHKPIFATLALLIAVSIGGTTYAAVNGGLSSITAFFGSEQKINDARIVKVDLHNCHDVNAFNAAPGTSTGDTPRYYRISDDAHITNQQMVSMAQSICRAAYSNPTDQAIRHQIAEQPQNKNQLVGNAEGIIVGLTSHSIDIQIPKEDTDNRESFVEHITQIDTNLAVLDGTSTPKGLGALRVGDHIYSEYRATGAALTGSETTALNQVDWSRQTLVIVTKQTPDEAAYDHYKLLAQSKAVQQVAPCDQTASGYCTIDELNSK